MGYVLVDIIFILGICDINFKFFINLADDITNMDIPVSIVFILFSIIAIIFASIAQRYHYSLISIKENLPDYYSDKETTIVYHPLNTSQSIQDTVIPIQPATYLMNSLSNSSLKGKENIPISLEVTSVNQ